MRVHDVTCSLDAVKVARSLGSGSDVTDQHGEVLASHSAFYSAFERADVRRDAARSGQTTTASCASTPARRRSVDVVP
ncbi:MAG: hypothetical protein WKF76_05435 [Nocardioidaceae bacterium]